MSDLAGVASLEEATVEASAVAEEEDVDGWRIRWSPGKAKRGRSVQALADGRQPLDAKLDGVVARYRALGLPALVRLSPVSRPPGLDDELARRGWVPIDDTVVMVLQAILERQRPLQGECAEVAPSEHAAWVGAQRGSARAEVAAHAARLARSPVPYRAFRLMDATASTVAGGQIAVDARGRAGLYDVCVDPAHRRRGHARALCDALIATAASAGAALAYLQVDAGNAPARALYRSMGFVDSHRYHYRHFPTPNGNG